MLKKKTATSFTRSIGGAGLCGRGLRASLTGGCMIALVTTDALAGSGFLLRSQSATTLGTAQAGMSTTIEDPSAMVFNPALTAYFTRPQIGLAVTPIFSSGRFEPSSATTILGTPIGGNDGGTPAKTGYPGSFFFATPLRDNVSVGFTAASLFGLGFRYDNGWVGRYHAGESDLLTYDLMPSIAYRSPSRKIAVGAGVNVRYARAKTTTAVDFGTADVLGTGGLFGGAPAANDGSLHTKQDAWDVGYTVGAVFEPTTLTRVGVSYRSKIDMNLKGRATFASGGPVGQALSAVSGQFTDSDTNAPLTLPAAVIAGMSLELSKDLMLKADVQWTQWSALDQLTLKFANPLQAPIETQLHWRNSWFGAVGLQKKLSEELTLRAGVAYDQTPTRRDTSTPAIPDANSVWLTFGASYRFDDTSKVDFVYGHIFVRDNPIALQATSPGNTLRGNLQGTIRDSSVDFFSLQYSHRF
jgi:long-chain fatty acid transport protein